MVAVYRFLSSALFLFLSVLSSDVENLFDLSSAPENKRTAIATDTTIHLCDRLRTKQGQNRTAYARNTDKHIKPENIGDLCTLSTARSLPLRCPDHKTHACVARKGSDWCFVVMGIDFIVHVGSSHVVVPEADEPSADERNLSIPHAAAAADLSPRNYRCDNSTFGGSRGVKLLPPPG